MNAEFSRIYRFVKLMVNEGFLAVNIYANVHDSKFTQVTTVTIIIYMARKVYTAFMFLECFEACQVS